jgi:hypothetical protein
MFSFPSLALQPHWQVRRGDSDSDTDSGEEEEEEKEKEKEAEQAEHVGTEVTIDCPLSRIPEKNCMWRGDLVRIQDHVEESHTDVQKPGPTFRCVSVKNTVLLVRCYNELFLYYKHFSKSGLMYAFVQQIGVTSKNFRYTIALISHNELMDNINYIFRMTKISEPFESIMNEEKCMVIDISFLEYYRLDGGIEMVIRIEESDDPLALMASMCEEARFPWTPTPQEEEVKLSDGTVKCPLLKIPKYKCSWLGKTTTLKLHLLTDHRYFHTAVTEFDCHRIERRILLISFNGELFLYYKHVTSTNMYVTLQQFDFTNEKYAFSIELLARDVLDNINFTSDVYSITEPYEQVYETDKCLSISISDLERFKMNSDINMKVRITRVQTQQETLVTGAE